MNSALLKFENASQALQEVPLDPAILAGAFAASPEPMAISENGNLIYANCSFTQLSATFEEGESPDGQGPIAVPSSAGWRNSRFSVGERSFSLTTHHRDSPRHSDAAHLEMVGRLAGGVAHDFNNLLTGILLYCDLLKTKLAPANPLGLKIEEIRFAAEQGAGIIRQLMTVGRGEQGAPRWVSFNHALKEMAPLLRHLAGEAVAITINLVAGDPRVGLSLAQAQQVILNLVLNARDAMPAGGTVFLESRLCELESRKYFEFSVIDSGSGMDPQTAANIFEPFYTTRTPGHGTGMGLVTVKRIVEDASGFIGVDTTLGKGTRMTVRLPQVELTKHEGEGHPASLQVIPVRASPQNSEIRQSQTQPRGPGL